MVTSRSRPGCAYDHVPRVARGLTTVSVTSRLLLRSRLAQAHAARHGSESHLRTYGHGYGQSRGCMGQGVRARVQGVCGWRAWVNGL
eukprot:1240369-Rhodomonas_salina.1